MIFYKIYRSLKRRYLKSKNKIPQHLPKNQYIEYRKSFLHKTSKILNFENLKIGEKSEIKDYVIIQIYDGLLTIGDYCQLNPFTVIYGGDISIGNNVMIAPHCMIASGNHDFKQLIVPMRFAGSLTKGPIVIEDDVWIGSNCTITDGVRIGKGSVIGANSCVITDVPPYSIFGGTPAKKIGERK